MARVQVIADDGYVALTERISAEVLHDEHFRETLAERVEWAAADAEAHDTETEQERGRAPATTPAR